MEYGGWRIRPKKRTPISYLPPSSFGTLPFLDCHRGEAAVDVDRFPRNEAASDRGQQ